MTETASPSETAKELVGLISNRATLETAIASLLEAGFSRSDISLLASHESVDAAEKEEPTLREALMPLLDEIRYEEPLVNAGLIAMAAGPVGAALSGLVAAGIGALSVRELLDEMTSLAEPEKVVAALKEGGVMIWVAVDSEDAVGRAWDIFKGLGATDIHLERQS